VNQEMMQATCNFRALLAIITALVMVAFCIAFSTIYSAPTYFVLSLPNPNELTTSLRLTYNDDSNLVRCVSDNLTSVTCTGRPPVSTTASNQNETLQPAYSDKMMASKDIYLQRIRQISQDISRPYINRLSSDQSADIVQNMGIRNLNGYSASQFLRCAGFSLFKKHVDSDGNLGIPKSSQTCKQMSFQEHGQVVGLVSFPGSGNSWVRQLLETSTGVYTGSIYCDHAYIEAGMIGEGVRSGSVIAVKCHSCTNLFGYTKRIYVVRNPFDALFANYNRKATRRIQNSSSSHVAEFNSVQFGKCSVCYSKVCIEHACE